MDLEIINPQRTIFKGYVVSVTVPGSKGEFQVLYNHAELISTLATGRIKIVNEKNEVIYFASSGGIIEVGKNKIIILAEEIYSPEEIDIETTEKEMKNAKSKLFESKSDKEELFNEIEKAKSKLRIVRK
ncbi:MAG: ATP synthase F1 subunit epsilon [Ignavibacteria bacterium]|nr:ATP synthase F1 subunit epsilon [Ignavibacteria bacterium]